MTALRLSNNMSIAIFRNIIAMISEYNSLIIIVDKLVQTQSRLKYMKC